MTEEPKAIDLVRELDIALHGETWARPQSPKEVWEGLLQEVKEIKYLLERDKEGRDEYRRYSNPKS